MSAQGGLRVVQFVHPGFEYHRQEHLGPRRQRSGVMGWKPGRRSQDRKFMLIWGSMLDAETGIDHKSVPLALWGEWEPPSVFWRIESPGRPLPSVLHAPFRPAEMPTRSVQNTDPMVFGDAFVYSNCLQATYRSLRTLSPVDRAVRTIRPRRRTPFVWPRYMPRRRPVRDPHTGPIQSYRLRDGPPDGCGLEPSLYRGRRDRTNGVPRRDPIKRQRGALQLLPRPVGRPPGSPLCATTTETSPCPQRCHQP
jgi:hypothetical protein